MTHIDALSHFWLLIEFSIKSPLSNIKKHNRKVTNALLFAIMMCSLYSFFLIADKERESLQLTN